MTDYGGGGISTIGLNTAMLKFNETITAGTNSVVHTHSLGRIVKINGVYGLDDNINVLKIINEGINSFEIALQGGILAFADTTISGTYE